MNKFGQFIFALFVSAVLLTATVATANYAGNKFNLDRTSHPLINTACDYSQMAVEKGGEMIVKISELAKQ